MGAIRVVYMSTVGRDLGTEEISEIVERSRVRNRAFDITGMLLVHDGSVVQVLEGPEEAVDELLERIEADPRHSGLLEVLREPMGPRQFADWSMGWIASSWLSGQERQIVSDGLGTMSESGRAHKLLQSFAKRAR
ncbi:MAG: BLUF domain-containing protein [Planctomycetota bacterium]